MAPSAPRSITLAPGNFRSNASIISRTDRAFTETSAFWPVSFCIMVGIFTLTGKSDSSVIPRRNTPARGLIQHPVPRGAQPGQNPPAPRRRVEHLGDDATAREPDGRRRAGSEDGVVAEMRNLDLDVIRIGVAGGDRVVFFPFRVRVAHGRSEEHTSE